LKPELKQLKKYRGGRWDSDLGEYYLVDLNRNSILEGHVDLTSMAKKLGVLAEYERVRTS
jgi:hypothetical protein